MTETWYFPTLEVVSAATGILLCEIQGVYDVLGFMLSDKLFTHQLPAALDAAAPSIVEQHPWIGKLDLVPDDVPTLKILCENLVAKYGETIPLTSIDNPVWESSLVYGNLLADAIRRNQEELANEQEFHCIECGVDTDGSWRTGDGGPDELPLCASCYANVNPEPAS